jgi:hypothetical protein
MDYETILAQTVALLKQEKRVAYRVLKRRLQLNDDLLEDLKDDLIFAKRLAQDEEGRVLVRVGDAGWPSGSALTPPQPGDIQVGQARPGDPLLSESQPLRPNAGSSRCCFVTWWTRPCSPLSLTRKTGARWCGSTKRRALK